MNPILSSASSLSGDHGLCGKKDSHADKFSIFSGPDPVLRSHDDYVALGRQSEDVYAQSAAAVAMTEPRGKGGDVKHTHKKKKEEEKQERSSPNRSVDEEREKSCLG